MCGGHPHRAPVLPHTTIEAIVSLDSRGQILLPKEVREKAGLKPGDKLAVITHVHGQEVAYIMLIPVERLAESLRQFLGPLLRELLEHASTPEGGEGR